MAGTWRRVLVVGWSLTLGVSVGVGVTEEGSSWAATGDGLAVVRAQVGGGRIVPVAQKTARQKARGKAGASKEADGAEPTPAAEKKQKDEQEKLSPSERDQRLETVGRERWKKADPKGTPEATSTA